MKNFHRLRTLATALGIALALPAGAVVYTYDDLNRLISATYASGKKISYIYDPAGNMLAVQIDTVDTGPEDSDLSATLTDSHGDPLTGLTLTIGDQTVTTDADGSFTVTGLAPGSYTLSLEGFAPVEVVLPLTASVCMETTGSDGEVNGSDSAEGDNKVTVCHLPGGDISKAKTLWVGAPALQAHLGHGDMEGVCPGDEPPEPANETVLLCLAPGQPGGDENHDSVPPADDTDGDLPPLPPTEPQPGQYEQPGVTLTDSGGVQIVTANGAKVIVQPAVQAPQALVAALRNAGVFQTALSAGAAAFLEDLGVHADIVQMNIDGTLTVYPGIYETAGMKYSAKPGLVSVPAPEGAEADTLAPADSALLPAGNGKLLKLHFNDKHGALKVQMLYPAAANVNALLEISSVTLDAAGPGTMSFAAHGETHTVLLDYAVAKGEAPEHNAVEFHAIDDANGDGVDDYQVVYPNGDTQKVFVIDRQ